MTESKQVKEVTIKINNFKILINESTNAKKKKRENESIMITA